MEGDREHQEAKPGTRPAIIRTMQSDLARATAEAGPARTAAIERIPPHGEYGTPLTPHARFSPLTIAVIALLLMAIGAPAIFLWLNRRNSTPPPLPPPAPEGFIFFDRTSEHVISPSREDLVSAIESAWSAALPRGSFFRLVLRRRSDPGPSPIFSTRELFEAIGAQPPPELAGLLIRPPQLFIHTASSGPEIGIMIEAEDTDGLASILTDWEPTILEDFRPLVPSATATTGPPTTFETRSYRNIEYRYRARGPDETTGIGYLYFPARSIILISTSEETMHQTLNRLFEQH